MKRPSRSEDGAYHINGKKYNELFGSRQQVWNGTAYKTAGELTKKALMMNKWGRIVSSKKHKTAKKENAYKSMVILLKKVNSVMLKRTEQRRQEQ